MVISQIESIDYMLNSETQLAKNMNKQDAYALNLSIWEKLMEEGQGGQMKSLLRLNNPTSLRYLQLFTPEHC